MSAKRKKSSPGIKIPKTIIATARFLSLISPVSTTLFAARLFTTPIRHKIPKREFEMERDSKKKNLQIPDINLRIATYHYGTGKNKILLVHGWSGRGTQLFKIADALIAQGYSTVSFDAPAHGKSDGKTTLMPEFVSCIFEIDRKFGPFTAAVGHSLGGMSLLNAVKRGFEIDRLVTIGSGDIVEDIMSDFIRKLKIDNRYTELLRKHFERKSDEKMDNFSAYLAASKTEIPVLLIHDQDDIEVPVSSAINIHRHLKNGKLMITNGLGHRKILGDEKVVRQTVQFIKNEKTKNNIAGDPNDDGNFVQRPEEKIG